MKRGLKIFAYVVSGVIFLVLLLTFIISYFYADEVKQIILGELNKSIRTKISAEEIDISIWSKFPNASLVFENVAVLSSEDFRKQDFKGLDSDTLLKAEKVFLQFNLLDIIRGKYDIKAIEVSDGNALLLNDSQGAGNYFFWEPDTASDDSPVRVKLEQVSLKSIDITYKNAIKDLTIVCSTKKFIVSGSFFDETYEVETSGGINLKRLRSGKTEYLQHPAYISANFDFDTEKYRILDGQIETGEMKIKLSGHFYVDPVIKVSIALNGDELEISSFLSLLPEETREKMGSFTSTGDFYFNGKMEGEISYERSPLIEIHFGVRNATLNHSSGIDISRLSCIGWYSNGTGHSSATTFLRLDSIQGSLPNSVFNGFYVVQNFDQPKVELMLKGTFDLAEVQELLKTDSVAGMDGIVVADLRFSGKMKGVGEFTKEDYKNGQVQGDISLKNVTITQSGYPYAFQDLNGVMSFRKTDLRIDSLSLRYREHKFNLSGYFRNIAGYILEDEMLSIDADLSCGDFDFKKFSGPETDEEAGFALPANMKLNADIHMSSFVYEKFKATKLAGNIELNDKSLLINGVSFATCSGQIQASGSLEINQAKNLEVELSTTMRNINITELFRSFDNFGQTFIQDKHLAGKMTAEINMKSEWDQKISLIEDKLLVEGRVIINNGELIKFEPMMNLSDFIAVSELKNIKFEKLETDIAISNRTIYIPNTEIRSSAMNLEISGEHSFDNKINYRIKVLLSELLAGKARKQKKEIDEFGVVESDGGNRTRLLILISGTTDDYKISYDTKGVKETIKESLQKEKETVKELLKDEFKNLFGKKDTTVKTTDTKTKPKDKPKNNNAVEIEF